MRNDFPTLVIFGASGDLTKRKLIPALFQLLTEKLIPEHIKVVGFARREKTDEQFRAEMRDALSEFSRANPTAESELLQSFISRLYYQCGNYDDPQSFLKLSKRLSSLDEQQGLPGGSGNYLFYLSTPPSVFGLIAKQLKDAGLVCKPQDTDRWTRVIVEKPFGRDLQSAQRLNNELLSVLDESQIYRIDHYLGKETVQNIMAFRFGNSIFEPLWNAKYIDHIQITVAESVAVGSRAGYYDHSGAIRDMVQNHILQLLALIAMEPPASFEANAVRDEKVKVLTALRLYKGEEANTAVVRAQYSAGAIHKSHIPSYLEEHGVAEGSKTETYIAIKAFVDNWRWAGVPFYIRTGKALKERVSEISIVFKQPPLALFHHEHHDGHVEGDDMPANSLTLRVQPNESIRLNFGLKVPGPDMILDPNDMEFVYDEVFDTAPPEAYERLILNAMLGDSTLFIRNDEVEAAWTFVDSIIESWQHANAAKVHEYEAGSWGPQAADKLLANGGHRWLIY